MNTSHERRQFWRSDFHAPARVTVAERSHVVKLQDVSLRGALIEHDGSWDAQAGQKCHLRIELGPEAAIVMASTVTHVDGRYIGLHCDHIDIDSITHLRHLVELNAENPAVLERDLSKLVGRR